MEKIVLADGETMQQRTRRQQEAQQLKDDCYAIVDVVNRKPGLPGKGDIAGQTGLSHARVAYCIRVINENETPYSRLDYGTSRAKEGPYAGQFVRGWWPMRYAVHQPVMDEADEHSASVELGVRRSRMMRLVYARGLTTKQAQAVVASIEARLDVQIEALSAADLDAFESLVLAEIDD